MKVVLSRRAFIIGAACGLGAGVVVAQSYPEPRVTKLSQWRSVKELESLKRAFEFIESPALRQMAPGRYSIDGEQVYATIVEDKTRAIETAEFETHRRYTDVHYLVRGTELIGSAPSSSLCVTQPYADDKEAALFERPKKYRKLILKSGDFAVFFPGQAHMPGCFLKRSEEIRKVVVKVLMA